MNTILEHEKHTSLQALEIPRIDSSLRTAKNVSIYPASIEEFPNQFVLSLILPGLQKQDFTIKVLKDILSIHIRPTAKLKLNPESDKFPSTFYYRLGDQVDVKTLCATYEGMILKTVLRKKDIPLKNNFLYFFDVN